MGGTYILNQIMDIESDRINKKLFLLSQGYIPVKFAYLELAILWISAIILSFKFSKVFLIFIIISIVMGILYSVPPIKLKGRPGFDTLANGIGYGMINLGIGWLIFRPFEWSIFMLFLPYFLSICAVFINTTIIDLKGDKNSDATTTAVFFKEGVSYILSMVLMAGAIVIAFRLKDLICLIPALISFPLFIYTTFYYLFKNQVNRRATIASFR